MSDEHLGVPVRKRVRTDVSRAAGDEYSLSVYRQHRARTYLSVRAHTLRGCSSCADMVAMVAGVVWGLAKRWGKRTGRKGGGQFVFIDSAISFHPHSIVSLSARTRGPPGGVPDPPSMIHTQTEPTRLRSHSSLSVERFHRSEKHPTPLDHLEFPFVPLDCTRIPVHTPPDHPEFPFAPLDQT